MLVGRRRLCDRRKSRRRSRCRRIGDDGRDDSDDDGVDDVFCEKRCDAAHRQVFVDLKLDADELRAFVLYFASFLLVDEIRDDRMAHFLLLVEAVYLCVRAVVRNEDVAAASERLRAYALGCEDIYGCGFPTVNTHLQVHLADVIGDFGPVPAFWCFPFERQYGRLGRAPSSKRRGWTEIEMARSLLRTASTTSAPSKHMDYGEMLGRVVVETARGIGAVPLLSPLYH